MGIGKRRTKQRVEGDDKRRGSTKRGNRQTDRERKRERERERAAESLNAV